MSKKLMTMCIIRLSLTDGMFFLFQARRKRAYFWSKIEQTMTIKNPLSRRSLAPLRLKTAGKSYFVSLCMFWVVFQVGSLWVNSVRIKGTPSYGILLSSRFKLLHHLRTKRIQFSPGSLQRSSRSPTSNRVHYQQIVRHMAKTRFTNFGLPGSEFTVIPASSCTNYGRI